MSSAENGKPAGRLVWISERQRDRLNRGHCVGPDGTLPTALVVVVAAWDAAPADSASELAQRLAVVMGCPTTLDAAALVLRALGVPSTSPTRSDNA